MSGYTKLFSSLVTSSVWQESNEARVVWITMLALCDRHGVVEASVPGLANVARVKLEQCQEALAVFQKPDPFSRSEENEGRRVAKVEGGYQILNYEKYRNRLSAGERQEYQRIKQAEYRKRKKVLKHEAGCEGASEAIRDGLAAARGDNGGESEAERYRRLAASAREALVEKLRAAERAGDAAAVEELEQELERLVAES